MLEVHYKKAEKLIVVLMMVGIVAMFQPWFRNLVELFEPLAPDARLGRTFAREIAPVIFRYGFYATFLSTVAFTVISHYNVEELRRAFQTKGRPLTFLLIALPVLYGFIVLGHLSQAYHYAALLGVVNFICALVVWNWKRWGLIGLGLSAVAEVGLASIGLASIPVAVALVLIAGAVFGLIWPKRAGLES